MIILLEINSKILFFVFQVVSFIGRIPLLAPITDALVSGKQSHGYSSEDTSPVSEILYGYGRRWTSVPAGSSDGTNNIHICEK